MSDLPSSVNSSSIGDSDKSSTSKGSRFSFGSSGRSFFRSPPLGTRSFRRSSGSPRPLDSDEFNDGGFSEVSSGSSASQIRSAGRVLAKRFDKMTISTRSTLLEHFPSGNRESDDPKIDRLDIKGRNLEIILEAALGISEQLQVFFNKHKEAIAGDKRAVNLEAQNSRIRSLDHQIFTTIAFYGDNGAGKSSLINALLDSGCIAPTSNDDSCTAMPIEFRARDRGQKMKSKYTVIADIMTDEEWLPLAKRLLEDFEEDLADVRAIAARDVLKTLFNLTEEDTPIDLKRVGGIPPDCREFAKCFNTQDHLELQEHVKKLNAWCWSVLKKITIYMDSPVLNTGVVLVDLPGLGNMNPMKAAVINGYLESCENIFVVSDVSRVGMDDLLLDPMFEPIARRIQLEASSKPVFIFTQIDNMARTADTPDWNKYVEISRNLFESGLTTRRKQAILERVETTRSLIKKSPQSRLCNAEVFYVSSLEYQWNHNRFVNTKTTSYLSVEESGVPSVRRFIQEKGLQRRESVVKSLVQGELMHFMDAVQIWCNDKQDPIPSEFVSLELQASRFEGLRKDIHDIINTEVSKPLSAAVELFRSKIGEDVIKNAAKEAQKSVTAGESAWLNVCHLWNKFARACNAKGVFTDLQTKKSFDWNQQLADPLVNRIIEPWGSAFSSPGETAAIFEKAAGLLYKRISQSISQSNPSAITDQGLRPISTRVDGVINAQAERWKAGLKSTNWMITNTKDKIREKLSPTYKEFSNIKGAQSVRQMAVENIIPEFILSHYQELCATVFKNLENLISELNKNLATEFDIILDDTESSYFYQPETSIKAVDLTNVKAELLDLCKYMKELGHRASQPRTTELGSTTSS